MENLEIYEITQRTSLFASMFARKQIQEKIRQGLDLGASECM